MTGDPVAGTSEDPPGEPSLSSGADVVIVGSGIAGLATALELARTNPSLRTLLLTRGALGGQGASSLAQGGVAAALDPSDSPELHAADTRAAADGLARAELVEILTREGPDRVRDLIRIGARFDRDSEGALSLGLEGAHSRRRILHARGDRTGSEVTRALRDAVRDAPGIRIVEGMEVLDLLRGSGRVQGVWVRDRTGRIHGIPALATVLATGGPGRVFLRTTSPPGLNGDGLAMAARAGALLSDLEFVQFHPTALDVEADPLPLVTEALRGAGARLVDGAGDPVFAADKGGELDSRDRVARALWSRIRAGTPVFLDCRSSPGARIAEDFPGVFALCRRHGVDPTLEPVPVTPAAHYHMGGVAVDADGRSSLEGLWAVGEVSASGLHGANRLASNSLLEGLVFGPRVARSVAAALPRLSSTSPLDDDPLDHGPAPESEHSGSNLSPADVLRIRTLLWENVGLVRDAGGLLETLEELDAMEDSLRRTTAVGARNLLTSARLLTRAALLREESLGSHYRSDHPERRPGPPRHSVLSLAPEAPGGVRASFQEAAPPCPVS